MEYPFYAYMRPFIDGNSPLSKIYGLYLKKLFEVLDLVDDRHQSISEYVSRPHTELDLALLEKSIVWKSFVSIVENTERAIKHIDELENEYNSDLMYYAIQKRIANIEEYGGEESDFNPDGTVRFSKKRKELKSYSLKSYLSYHIRIKSSSVRGELIGESTKEDLSRFSDFVRRGTDFSFFKLWGQFTGSPLQLSRIDSEGNIKPFTLADQIEGEINEDIQNEKLAKLVDLSFEYGISIASNLSQLRDFDDPSGYFELRTMLQNLMNLNISN